MRCLSLPQHPFFRILVSTLLVLGNVQLLAAQRDPNRSTNPVVRPYKRSTSKPSSTTNTRRRETRTEPDMASEPARNQAATVSIDDLVEEAIDDGNNARDEKQYDRAITFYERALSRNAHEARAYYGLGNIYSDTNRYAEAADSFEEAIRLKPDFAVAHNGLGTAYSMLRRYDEAIERFREAIELNPEDGRFYNNLGFAYKALERYDEAIVQFKKAINRSPRNAPMHYVLGTTYVKVKNTTGAIEQYQILQQLDAALAKALLDAINEL